MSYRRIALCLHPLLAPCILWVAITPPSFASSFQATDKMYQIADKPVVLPPIPSANDSLICLPPFPRLATLPKLASLPFIHSEATNLAKIAVEYAASGQYDQAIKTAQSIKDNYFLADTLVKIASFERQRQPKQSLQLLSQALGVVAGIQEDYSRDSILDAIAIQYATAGEFKLALQTAQGIKNRSQKDDTISEIAIQYAASGRQDQAIRLIQTLPDEDKRNDALVRIAEYYADLSKYDQALQIVESLKSNYDKADALSKIARQALKAGQAAQVVEPIRAISDDCTKSIVVTDLTGQYNQPDLETNQEKQTLERFLAAFQIAQSIKAESLKTDALSAVAIGYVDAGQIDLGWKLTQTLPEGYGKNRALARLADYYLEVKQPDQALTYAEMMKNSAEKADVFTKIAGSYTKAGQAEKASRLLSQALEITKMAAESNSSLIIPPIPRLPPSLQKIPSIPTVRPLPELRVLPR
ncbi:hypothetical protein I8748_07655 [Nostoc sp. CENA67]|uniref:Uncharacterized protein n=1 Tax=Amazonocrinis nigriterrae CENA67 TaxID=2794033 RepID=A0A8J7HLY6_9NOST|nr:hypothetical protein [Amazonocrinis nigriterrae]MBH8562048.1 hypothetical protein [Amazonocrinis nigriterrae CENA67]